MSASHSILLVEDDEYQREPLAILFRLEGYVVVAAASADEGLALLDGGFAPCVIVLDLAMPGMSGEQFREAQLLDPALSHIPVILYSGGDDLAHVARSLGVAAHASKPDADRLLALVAAHC